VVGCSSFGEKRRQVRQVLPFSSFHLLFLLFVFVFVFVFIFVFDFSSSLYSTSISSSFNSLIITCLRKHWDEKAESKKDIDEEENEEVEEEEGAFVKSLLKVFVESADAYERREGELEASSSSSSSAPSIGEKRASVSLKESAEKQEGTKRRKT
jgi:hypothetical protein